MFFTLYYMASTWFRSWRLNSYRHMFRQMFEDQATIVLYKEKKLGAEINGLKELKEQLRGAVSDLCSNRMDAHVYDFWCYSNEKRGCSILPKQILDISDFLYFGGSNVNFPISLMNFVDELDEKLIYLLIEARYLLCEVPEFANLNLCHFGVPIAWKADSYFSMLLKTDEAHLIKLGMSFMSDELSLDSVLEVFRLETVGIVGEPCAISHLERIPSFMSAADGGDGVQRSQHLYVNVLRRISQSASVLNCEKRVCEKLDFPPIKVVRRQPRPQSPTTSKVEGSSQTSPDGVVNLPNLHCDYHRRSRLYQRVQEGASLRQKTRRKRYRSPQLFHSRPACLVAVERVNYPGLDRPTASASDIPEEEQRQSLRHASLTVHPKGSSCSLDDGQESHTIMKPMFRNPVCQRVRVDDGDDREVFTTKRDIDAYSSNWSLPSVSVSPTDIAAPIQHKGEQNTGKPPNILIFSDSPSSVENIKIALDSVLQKHRYTVYSLTLNEMLTSPWTDQARLLVVHGNVPATLKPLLMKYLLNNGGRMLCLCSDLLGVFLPTFKTAEVRPDEVVRFSYDRWQHVALLHHIFCYQPSPKTSKFSMDESPSSNTAFTNTPSTVDLLDVNSKIHILHVKVLAAEETWQTPTLLLAVDNKTSGIALFSQVHLEVDPHSNEKNEYDSDVRLSVLSHLLSTHLNIDCETRKEQLTYKPGYFLGKHEAKRDFLLKMAVHLKPDEILEMTNLTLKFAREHSKNLPSPSPHMMPVMLFDCPQTFSTVEYFDNLQTEKLGRLVIYCELMTSSMNVLNGPIMEHGFVAIARQQSSGVGRGGNAWISPDGCAMFSIQLHIPINSALGQRLSLLQHIMALSIVNGICSRPEYKHLDIGIKWPNDVYAGRLAKIGGLIVTTSVYKDIAVCNAGCAINIDNSLPTTCINDMIKEYNKKWDKKVPELTMEKYFAIVFNELELMINGVQKSGSVDIIFDLYYKYWLHNMARVKIVGTDGVAQTATIVGLDDFGFLRVRGEEGNVFAVHPDGNSFNMLSGLIVPK